MSEREPVYRDTGDRDRVKPYEIREKSDEENGRPPADDRDSPYEIRGNGDDE